MWWLAKETHGGRGGRVMKGRIQYHGRMELEGGSAKADLTNFGGKQDDRVSGEAEGRH